MAHVWYELTSGVTDRVEVFKTSAIDRNYPEDPAVDLIYSNASLDGKPITILFVDDGVYLSPESYTPGRYTETEFAELAAEFPQPLA